MRKILIATTLVMFAGTALAQTNPPSPQVPQQNSPTVEKSEKDKQKGNTENQNPQDTKAKEQAPKKN